jgi:uncharacterized protein (TIGR02646 family)
MRRRDLHLLNPSAEWRQKAENAAGAISKDGTKISQYSEVWTDLKSDLAKLSHNKCWYCESREARSDNAVDHFRPKSRYPWRAVSYWNFRFACTFCNSRRRNPETGEAEGKGDFFPLFDGSQRATREEDVGAEEPILLDPCVSTDVGLLDFHSNGTPCPAHPGHKKFERRAIESIKFYHLDHPELNEQRRVLALKIEDWIKQANALYPCVESGGKPVLEQAFNGFVETVARTIDDHAELSAFARRMLKVHRSKRWVEYLLDA